MLSLPGFNVDIFNAEASQKEDRFRILNSIARRDESALDDVPPPSCDEYDEVTYMHWLWSQICAVMRERVALCGPMTQLLGIIPGDQVCFHHQVRRSIDRYMRFLRQ